MQMQLVCIVAFLLTEKCGTLGSCAVFVIITTHIIISAPATVQGLLATIALSSCCTLGRPFYLRRFSNKDIITYKYSRGSGMFF